MLFNRDIEPSCAYCRFSADLGHDEFVCVKNGVMSGSGSCKLFRYAPIKRVPPVMPKLKYYGLSDEDFQL